MRVLSVVFAVALFALSATPADAGFRLFRGRQQVNVQVNNFSAPQSVVAVRAFNTGFRRNVNVQVNNFSAPYVSRSAVLAVQANSYCPPAGFVRTYNAAPLVVEEVVEQPVRTTTTTTVTEEVRQFTTRRLVRP